MNDLFSLPRPGSLVAVKHTATYKRRAIRSSVVLSLRCAYFHCYAWKNVVKKRTGPAQSCMRRRRWTVAFCCGVFAVVTAMGQQQLIKITGVVSDSSGAAIANASVEFEANGKQVRTETDDAGNFTVLSTQPYGTLSISSPGFNTIKIDVAKTNGPLHIKLEPAGLIERILVTADEERIPATPTSQFVISRRELDLAGALTIDDVLRQAPGFSLFRRSGSLSANPTSQGVSLRGVGANGASRAVVLVDGVPLNSPFGGWVYWNRLARVSIENVQVYNGGTSDLYGSGALGGVINIRSNTAPATFFEVEASAGNKATAATSFSGGK